jgi:hypothetical protein
MGMGYILRKGWERKTYYGKDWKGTNILMKDRNRIHT